jgi:predicted metal-dependent phosphoesterase TrpH
LSSEVFERLAPQIDIIEVFNARCPSMQPNTKAKKFAGEHRLPGTAGSDAHTIGEIGKVIVEMSDFNSPQEFIEALKKAKIQGRRSSPLVHFHSTIAKFKKGLKQRKGSL